jgi:SMC interacting uncharacterized protein involved in chromosome segregation
VKQRFLINFYYVIMTAKKRSTYKRVFNPFTDILFKKARNARDTNRKILQAIPEKRKVSSKALGEAANCKAVSFFR